jgi:hypothetical protein
VAAVFLIGAACLVQAQETRSDSTSNGRSTNVSPNSGGSTGTAGTGASSGAKITGPGGSGSQ